MLGFQLIFFCSERFYIGLYQYFIVTKILIKFHELRKLNSSPKVSIFMSIFKYSPITIIITSKIFPSSLRIKLKDAFVSISWTSSTTIYYCHKEFLVFNSKVINLVIEWSCTSVLRMEKFPIIFVGKSKPCLSISFFCNKNIRGSKRSY